MSDDAFHGWVRPGPHPPGGPPPGPGETLDAHCGHWRIYQFAGGHRYSLDDLLTAWFGTTWCPRPERVADLGCGVGSIALAVAWRCPGSVIHGLEAQPASVGLARRSVAFNGLTDRVFIHPGDLRDPDALASTAPFDLVLGAPPYWPAGTHRPADHPQTVPARFETRGDVGDYARAAARLLAPGGMFSLVFALDQIDRAESACRAAGLLPLHRQVVRFKAGQPYGVTLLACGRAADLPPGLEQAAALPRPGRELTIRDADGRIHPDWAAIRLVMGFPPGLGAGPSG